MLTTSALKIRQKARKRQKREQNQHGVKRFARFIFRPFGLGDDGTNGGSGDGEDGDGDGDGDGDDEKKNATTKKVPVLTRVKTTAGKAAAVGKDSAEAFRAFGFAGVKGMKLKRGPNGGGPPGGGGEVDVFIHIPRVHSHPTCPFTYPVTIHIPRVTRKPSH